jgi:hypothetical protein
MPEQALNLSSIPCRQAFPINRHGSVTDNGRNDMAVRKMMVALALLAGVFVLAAVPVGVAAPTAHGGVVRLADSWIPTPTGTPTPTRHGAV